jgi:O-antigen ligase
MNEAVIAHSTKRSNGAEAILQASFLLFIFLALTQEFDDLFRAFFFVGMVPATLYLAFRKRALGSSITSPSYLSAAGLITILYLSVYWSDIPNRSEEILRHSRWFLETLIFFTALHLYAKLGMHRKPAHGYTIQAGLIAGVLIAVFLYMINSQYPERITGLGLLDDIIASSSILIMLWVVSLTSLRVGQKKDLLLATLALISVSLYAMLNQSRAPLGVTLFAWPVFIIMFSKDIRRFIVPAILIVGILIFVTDPRIFDSMINRGTSYRLEIWGATLSNIDVFFWKGIGAASSVAETEIGTAIKQAMGVRHDHPHNLFLSTWVDGGILAFASIVLLFAALFLKAFTQNNHERNLALWMLATVGGVCFTDPDTLVTSPQEIYLVFWTPIGLLSGLLYGEWGKVKNQEMGEP